jgi:hypothetical protein
MSPVLTKALLVLSAVACFVAAYFIPEQQVVLVAAGVASLGLAAPELGKMGGKGGGAAALCLALALPTFTACSSLTRAERIRYGIDGAKAACKLAGVYPAEVPADVKLELDEVCLALGASKAEAVEAPPEDAGTE